MISFSLLNSHHGSYLWCVFYFMVVQIERIRPVWYRELKLEIVNEEVSRNCGVYVYFLGDKFYVGVSVNIRARLMAHRTSLNHVLHDETLNPEYNYQLFDAYSNILYYLKDNPEIDTIYGYALQICDNRDDAYEQEQELIDRLGYHFLGSRCFNVRECTDILDIVPKEMLLEH